MIIIVIIVVAYIFVESSVYVRSLLANYNECLYI